MRILEYSGEPREIGRGLGEELKTELEDRIKRFLAAIDTAFGLDRERLSAQAKEHFARLPSHFQEEIKGLAEGAGMEMGRILEWCFADSSAENRCTGVLCSSNGDVWIARNNDYVLPDAWDTVTVRVPVNRLASALFGMAGDIFSATGINERRLWLHYNWVPRHEAPSASRPAMLPEVFLREALETCSSLGEVERLLNSQNRESGMLLFAVAGETEQAAVFECAPSMYRTEHLQGDFLCRTNHSRILNPAQEADSGQTCARYTRLCDLLDAAQFRDLPGDLIRILADPQVEQESTVYSAVSCPAKGPLWFSGGTHRAASLGRWERVEWPWD